MLRIKELCKERGKLLKDLASELGISDIGLLKSLKSGNIPLSRLIKIADILNVGIEELFQKSTESDLYGIVSFKGKTYRIDSVNALRELLTDYLEVHPDEV